MMGRFGMELGVACIVAVFACSASAGPNPTLPFSDFDDGTMQGWTKYEPFEGTLSLVPTGGNPGGWLHATDTLAGGGGLVIQGPAEFRGDLSVFSGFSWDEIVIPQSGGVLNYAVTPIIRSPNGQWFSYYGEVGAVNVWHSRTASFDPDLWVPYYAGSDFYGVLQNCTLCFNLDAWLGLGPEAGIDNIRLLPEPAAGLFCMVGALITVRRRRNVV